MNQLELIKEALEKARAELIHGFHRVHCLPRQSDSVLAHNMDNAQEVITKALALIPIIEANMLPELPEGIKYYRLWTNSINEFLVELRYKTNDDYVEATARGIGNTPNAAVLAAREKVRG